MEDTAQTSETHKIGDGSVGSDSSIKEKVLENTRNNEAKPTNDVVDSLLGVAKERDTNLRNGDRSHPPSSVICDFYAKGWCIKGSSCRFLHIKDNQKKNSREGLVEQGQGSRLSNYCPEMSKFMALNDNGNGFKTQCGSVNGSLFRDQFHPEFAVSSGHSFGKELNSFQHARPHNLRIESFASKDSSNSSSSISAWTGSSLQFSYSSMGTTRLDSIPSSLHHGSFHFSGSKPPDKLTPSKRKNSLNDWEPSDPFKPSLVLLSMISVSGSLYDPLRDSVESPKTEDASLKPSLYCQGSSNQNASIHQNNGLARNNDTMSVSSHNTNHGNDMRAVEVEVVGTSTGVEDYKNAWRKENSLSSSAVKDVTEATSDVRPQNGGSGNSVAAKTDSFRNELQTDAGSNMDQSVNEETREIRQFRAALIEYVKELLKPRWRDGHISKAAHNKIVRKAVQKVLSTLPHDQVPVSMESTQKYLAASHGKIDRLIEGYAEIYGKL